MGNCRSIKSQTLGCPIKPTVIQILPPGSPLSTPTSFRAKWSYLELALNTSSSVKPSRGVQGNHVGMTGLYVFPTIQQEHARRERRKEKGQKMDYLRAGLPANSVRAAVVVATLAAHPGSQLPAPG